MDLPRQGKIPDKRNKDLLYVKMPSVLTSKKMPKKEKYCNAMKPIAFTARKITSRETEKNAMNKEKNWTL